MEKIYIFGHKKPDTDAVTSAIALEYLKKELGYNAEARILGSINKETEFVLNYFDVPEPKYLNDVKLQIKDLNYHKNCYLNVSTSIANVYNFMVNKNITGVPIVDDNKHFVGLVTVKTIFKNMFQVDQTLLKTSLNNIVEVLKADVLTSFDDEIEGHILAATYRSTTFLEQEELYDDSVLIIGDRHSLLEYAVNKGIKLIILVGNCEIKKEHLEIAKKNKVNININY